MQENHNDIEYQAGATLVDQGITFDIPYFFGRTKRFRIRPLRPGTIVKMGMEVSRMRSVDDSENMLHELFEKSGNIPRFASMLAHAVINREITQMWKFRYYRWLFLNRVESMDNLYNLFLLTIRQMGPDRFFFIMALTKRMNLMAKKPTTAENTGEETLSGEP